MSEVTEDPLAALRGLIQSEMIDLNTSIPAVVVSYSGGLASVRPIGNKRFADGDSLPFPVIHAVPVRWPVFNGGLCGVRGPIKAGDKCHLVFAQQATDNTDDLRRHDLTDAYALMCDNSQASQGGNDSDMVMYFGSAYIRIGAGGEVEIVAPGGLKFTTPATENTGTLETKGEFTYRDGMVGFGSATSNGRITDERHTHSGVESGPDTSGPVNS
jgi:hypothetical protein